MSRSRVPKAAAGAPKRSYDVFISFKNTDPSGGATEDSIWARQVYSALKAEGIRVFFSEVELQRLGAGHFAEAIDAALDSCRIMVVVSSCREHVESKYVAFEWRTFLNDMRGGRKEGELFILNCGDLRAQDLPIGLRLHQVFRTGDLAKLTRSVQNALPARRKLGDLVHASLHCHDPKKGEDKVYVVTIREDEIGYRVEAHWGPRMARRLVSQLKGVGISERQEAERLADRLVQSKRSSGYIPRGVVQLLTRDARKLLEIDLGLKGATEAPGWFQSLASAPVGIDGEKTQEDTLDVRLASVTVSNSSGEDPRSRGSTDVGVPGGANRNDSLEKNLRSALSALRETLSALTASDPKHGAALKARLAAQHPEWELLKPNQNLRAVRSKRSVSSARSTRKG